MKASDKEERDLIVMSNNIPFDDQIKQRAEITDLKLPMIQAHLADISSDLAATADKTKFSELVRKMNIAEGPDEFLKPKNIGLLMFNNDPSLFFPCARIDLIEFKSDVGDKYTEKIFKGSIKQQLEDALVYIKNYIIAESVIKVPGKAKAIRYFNYPFEAIEEALVNTIYHRSYEDDSPIEFRVFPNRIEMISYPGPLPPLNKEKLKSGNIVARKYRNRRIGDFLKELHLTEGRGTGIPKIKRVMVNNGSPEPIFETDDELSYFLTVLPIHPEWIKDKVGDKDGDIDRDKDGDRASEGIKTLSYCLRPKKRREIMAELGLHNNYDNFFRHVKPLLDDGYLEFTIPGKPSSGNQQYRTTPKGTTYLSELNKVLK